MRKIFETVTKTFKEASEEVTKTITEDSRDNNKALVKIKDNTLNTMNDRVY